MPNIYMPETISIGGKKANATIFCSDLIRHNSDVIFLKAYGPTQEVRAFAQILLESGDITSDNVNITSAKLAGIMKIIPNLANGYSALFVVPTGNTYIIGDTDEECFDILSRILDQAYFVHRDWYKEVVKLNARLDPKIGTKKCYILVKNLAEEVLNRVKFGAFKFPKVSASLTVETIQKQEAPASK